MSSPAQGQKSNTFLSCDWGTSSFRLRLIDSATLNVLDEYSSAQGIATTHAAWKTSSSDRQTFYKNVLAEAVNHIKNSSGLPIILSGMASSSIGIEELPYKEFPFGWKSDDLLIKNMEGSAALSHTIYLVSGMRCENDIMRGEETILLGSHQAPGSGLYILPGTHSKHVMTEGGKAVYFKTYMTGELFNIVMKHSILSNSLTTGDDPAAFKQGVRVAEVNNVINTLFSVRVRQVLFHETPVSNYQYLSGLIIGAELKDLIGKYDNVNLVGDGPLMNSYETALTVLGIKYSSTSAATALIQGHGKIFKELASHT